MSLIFLQDKLGISLKAGMWIKDVRHLTNGVKCRWETSSFMPNGVKSNTVFSYIRTLAPTRHWIGGLMTKQ